MDVNGRILLAFRILLVVVIRRKVLPDESRNLFQLRLGDDLRVRVDPVQSERLDTRRCIGSLCIGPPLALRRAPHGLQSTGSVDDRAYSVLLQK